MPTTRQAVDAARSYLLLNHGPVTLVSSAHGGRSNVMAASWAMPLDFDPPKLLLVVDASTLTRELIEASGEFALNIPCAAQVDQVLAAGSLSGRDGDKFARCGLATAPAATIGAPLVDGCVAWLECRVIPYPENQRRHDLFIAEVLAAWADPEVFAGGRWQACPPARRTLHYQAGGSFFVTGGPIEAKPLADAFRGAVGLEAAGRL